MKRYEKLGIDLNTVEGLEAIIKMDCKDIKDGRHLKCPHRIRNALCERCIAERLLEEIPSKKVPRGCTYTDFKKAWCDFVNDVGSGGGFVDWLSAEIEVEADD